MRLHQLTQALKSQTRRLEAELAEAAAYVASLLPADKTASAGSASSVDSPTAITSRFISSQALGGDCFDHYWLDPDYLVVYLLDVSGHGLGAALLSTSVLNVLRSQSLPGVNFYRPETVLKGLNEAFQMTDQNEKYFTIWYGVYNRVTRELSYASAGHPPAVLVSPATPHAAPRLSPLRTAGLPIGMLPEVNYQWQRCQVAEGGRLYIFSDGIYEIQPANPEPQTVSPQSDFSPYSIGPFANRSIAPLENHPTESSVLPQLGLDGFINLLTHLESYRQLNVDNIIHYVSDFGGDHFDDDLSLLEIAF